MQGRRKKLLEADGLSQKVSVLPHYNQYFPSLFPQDPATILEAKCVALKTRFCLPIPPANSSDIPKFQYPAEKSSPPSITLKEIAFALSKGSIHEAPGPEGIPM